MIVVENISKSFNGLTVLHDISVVFEEGKTNLIIGQSGSGKTVLVKCIIGLHVIDKGNIFYHNRDFVSMSLKEKKQYDVRWGNYSREVLFLIH
jgi:phospholipid/cholesterol/gamma-HCH transport system ATP-binding protein